MSEHDEDRDDTPTQVDAPKETEKSVPPPGVKLRGVFAEKLSESLFKKLSTFVNEELGIKMHERKKVMLEARLRKRLRALDMGSFKEYAEYVFSPEGFDHEVIHLLDVVTTNKTDFFREPKHYDALNERVIPELLKKKRPGEPLNVWSAGCSSGEEPYTLAIVFSEYERKNNLNLNFSIHGTDVSTHVLYKALDAVYKEHTIETVPKEIKKRYFLRSRDKDRRLVRVEKEIRDKVSFSRVNFMDPTYEVGKNFDIVFCRNVMIYFDRPTQTAVINRLCRHLREGGYMFMGHSETLMGIDAPLRQIVSTVYYRIPG
jgi:chemotaxis protein methyltransferase CheR